MSGQRESGYQDGLGGYSGYPGAEGGYSGGLIYDDGTYAPGHGNSDAPDPDTPRGLSAVAVDESIVLTWSDANLGVTYVIERTNMQTAVAERFTSTAQGYADAATEAGVIYTYRVYAYDAATGKYSGWSTTVSAQR